MSADLYEKIIRQQIAEQGNVSITTILQMLKDLRRLEGAKA